MRRTTINATIIAIRLDCSFRKRLKILLGYGMESEHYINNKTMMRRDAVLFSMYRRESFRELAKEYESWVAARYLPRTRHKLQFMFDHFIFFWFFCLIALFKGEFQRSFSFDTPHSISHN